MQTDIWPPETAHADRCPLCNKPLQKGSRTCPGCGSGTRSSAGWQHESPGYAAASSLPSLSLFIAETPTTPPRPSGKATHRLPDIDEIDTVPPRVESFTPPPVQLSPIPGFYEESPAYVQLSPALHFPIEDLPTQLSPALHFPIEDLPTQLSPALRSHVEDSTPTQLSPALHFPVENSTPAQLSPVLHPYEEALASASWTAGKAAKSSYAELIASRSPRARQAQRAQRARSKNPLGFNPLDRMRWWLLHPGRLEFLLWIGGTILLLGVTCAFVLGAASSFGWLGPTSSPPQLSSGNTPTTSQSATPTPATPATNLVLLTNIPLPPGHALSVSGHGFSPRGHIVFLLDNHEPLLNQSGAPGSTDADAQGNFITTLWLGSGSSWSSGRHMLIAQEIKTRRQAAIPITITPPPSNSGGGIAQTTPAPVNPGNPNPNPTPAPGNPGGPTPVPPTPTPTVVQGKTPTPAPTPSPSPSPSPTSVPTSTATPGSTPTPASKGTPAAATPTTPTASPTAASSTSSANLGNSLNESGATTAGNRLGGLNPLVWIIVACYCLSMILLGLAGVLRKRRLD